MTCRVTLTFDVDLHLLWTGSFKRTNLEDMSRGLYGINEGLPRILKLLREEEIKATFFVPAKLAGIFPDKIKALSLDGHEIAAHGYAHERWNELEQEQEDTILQKSKAILEQTIENEVVGFRSPAWNLNKWSTSLLLKHGYLYDSSLMASDYHPYLLRDGDQMDVNGNLFFGEETNITEFPVAWELDDFPYFAFTGKLAGLRLPSEVLAYWKSELDGAIEERGHFILTMHPQVIGRKPRLQMIKELIRYAKSLKVEFMTLQKSI